jgi:methylase of polypeptide subunit release factors
MYDDENHLHWNEGDTAHSALWRSEAGVSMPSRMVMADDTMSADVAYKLASEGTALLWRGDFQNARHLLQALTRRVEQPLGKTGKAGKGSALEAFNQHRQQQGRRARLLGMLLMPFEADHTLPLRRAPDVKLACEEAYGPGTEPYVASLRELLGLVGAHEWRKKGVPIEAVKGRIHAHHGVFSPIRGEYVDLVEQAPWPLPKVKKAFDIGTGTGVLAAVLARRGLKDIVATDLSPRALACARENIERLDLSTRIKLVETSLFPPGKAGLIVCNPPWVPTQPNSPLEAAVYDPDSQMLRGFLSGLADHLIEGGEGWLILSDLAEHLGLRSRQTLLGWIAEAGLVVKGRLDIAPRHPKAQDATDPLHMARAKELTSLWRLGAAASTDAATPQAELA